jgi:hypothetical protein
MPQSKSRPVPRDVVHELLVSEGYKFIDDVWEEYGRRTYIHDDEASRAYVTVFARCLASAGWERDKRKMRKFMHPGTGEIIELEPGGSETSGHFLHYMNEIEKAKRPK